MQGIEPTLEIVPFDRKFCLKAVIDIPAEEQQYYVSKSFFLCVIEIRSAMSEKDIEVIKRGILDTCQQLINRNGITNIGFIINEQYVTIRNPNYQGIKDLLTQRLLVRDQTDFRNTIQCLRHTIMNERQKLKDNKLTLLIFTSNVSQDTPNPIKQSYRVKMNQHLPNYFDEIRKLRRTLREVCFDSYSYVLGYVRTDKKEQNQQKAYKYLYDPASAVDTGLLYQLSSCTFSSPSFDVVDSSTALQQKFSSLCSLILYEFHEFSIMIPVTQNYSLLNNLYSLIEEQREEEDKQIVPAEEQENEDDLEIQEQLAYFLQEELESQEEKPKHKYLCLKATNIDETKFVSQKMFVDKLDLNLPAINQKGFYLTKTQKKAKQATFPVKKKLRKQLMYQFAPQFNYKVVDYHEPSILEEIQYKADFFQAQLSLIIKSIISDIVKYKKRYIGNKQYQYYIEVNDTLQFRLRERVLYIENIAKEIMAQIFDPTLVKTQGDKRKMFQCYSNLKVKLDAVNQNLMRIYKKQIQNEDLGKLSQALNYDKVRSSLRRKLIKRVNSYPRLIDDTYDAIEKMFVKEMEPYPDFEAKYHVEKSEIGNCMYSLNNFAKALYSRDGLGIIFQIERPDTAIGDPGRIRIRQVSTMLTSISKFFQIHQYGIAQSWEQVESMIPRMMNEEDYSIHKKKEETKQLKVGFKKWQYCETCFCNFCQIDIYRLTKNKDEKVYGRYVLQKADSDWIENIAMEDKETSGKGVNNAIKQYIYNKRIKQEYKESRIFNIKKSNYTENWDYWNRVESKQTHYGIMPLYICQQNWKVSKLLMKLCLGWTACGQPLGYSFSQYLTIPFMVQSSLIRSIQQIQYKIEQLTQDCQSEDEIYTLNSILNYYIHKQKRYQTLLKYVQKTCEVIMKELSTNKYEQNFSQKVVAKYQDYKAPINRTIDIINNNSSFIGQVYTAIKLGCLQKPTEEEFHQFFKRLIEEQLRRQTDGWNEEEIQDKFENRLLNAKIEEMDKPKYIVADSVYKDRFQEAFRGMQVYRTAFQIDRQRLEMMIKQNNSFNDTQSMLLIEYKRLYQNRVLWFWYIRFRLYGEKQRKSIHKWKSLDLSNSYKLFTMIIQNKKQRKNWKRRQAITSHLYVDPFDYYAARSFLELQFTRLRNKKEAKNIVLLNNQKYGKAAEAFAQTRDLEQAAGALMNTGLNQELMFFYYELFRDPKLLEQKLKLLLNGEYKGVQLLKFGWMMSKKKMAALRRKFPYEFQKYQYMF